MRFALPFLVFSVVIFGSCSSPKTGNALVSQFSGTLPLIMQNDSGLLHGIELGMSVAQVKARALKTDSLSQEEKDYLLFEGKLTPAQYYTYDCDFDEKGLENLNIDVYLTDQKTAVPLMEDFKKYFTRKYGAMKDSLPASDYFSWMVNEGKRPAKLTLSADDGYLYGKLSISFYDKNFDTSSPPSDSLVRPL